MLYLLLATSLLTATGFMPLVRYFKIPKIHKTTQRMNVILSCVDENVIASSNNTPQYSKNFLNLYEYFKNYTKGLTHERFESEIREGHMVILSASHKSAYRYENYIVPVVQQLYKKKRYVVLLDTCKGKMAEWQNITITDFEVPSINWIQIEKLYTNVNVKFAPIIEITGLEESVQEEYKILNEKYYCDNDFRDPIDGVLYSIKDNISDIDRQYFLTELVGFVKGYPIPVKNEDFIYVQQLYLPISVYSGDINKKRNWIYNEETRGKILGQVSEAIHVKEKDKKWVETYECDRFKDDDDEIKYYSEQLLKLIHYCYGFYYMNIYNRSCEHKNERCIPPKEIEAYVDNLYLPCHFYIFNRRKMVDVRNKSAENNISPNHQLKENIIWQSKVTDHFLERELKCPKQLNRLLLSNDISNAVTSLSDKVPFTYTLESVGGSKFKSYTFFTTIKVKISEELVFGASLPIWTNSESVHKLETNGIGNHFFYQKFVKLAAEIASELTKEKISEVKMKRPKLSDDVYHNILDCFSNEYDNDVSVHKILVEKFDFIKEDAGEILKTYESEKNNLIKENKKKNNERTKETEKSQTEEN